jgi:CRISPR-associated protein (TIGR02584 family)
MLTLMMGGKAITTDNGHRHILLCVAGMTPQTVTETLYALTQLRGERVDEVRVITTLRGGERLLTSLLAPGTGEFFNFCRDYRIDPSTVKFDETTIILLKTPDGRTLEDIRTPEENEFAGDHICEVVRGLTVDKNARVHASVAGGRKTMGIYLASAMQLYGRAHDVLSHVLVGEEFETNPEFFYPPPEPHTLKTRDGREVSTADAEIRLADVPFIRLRGVSADILRAAGARLYGEVVSGAQQVLDVVESEYDLQIDLRRYTVTVKGRSVRLTPREMFFYAMFAEFCRRGADGGAAALDDLTPNHFAESFARIAHARGERIGVEEASSYPGFDFLPEMLAQLRSRSGDDWMEFREKFLVIAARIKGKFSRKGLDERYTIALRDERGTSRYGLGLAPERVRFL